MIAVPAPASQRWRQALVILVGIVVVVDAAFLVTLAVHRFGPDIEGLKHVFDLGRERNVPTAVNAALLLGLSLVFAIAARRTRSMAPSRRSLVVAAAAVFLLCVDEALQLHERAGAPTAELLEQWGIDPPTYAWVLPGAAVAAVGVVATVRWARVLPVEVRRPLLLGVALYGSGALGVEAVNGWLVDRDAEYPYVAGTLLEETLEMMACIVALTGASRLLTPHVNL